MYKELYNIFSLNGFKEYNINKEEFGYIDEIKFFAPKENLKKHEYYFVINIKKTREEDLIKLLNEDFNNIYTEVSYSKYFNNYIIKNTTAIIFLELEDLDSANNNSSLNKKILDIEENKYNFKKNVITYTEKQIEDFKEFCSNEKNINIYINKVIHDKEKFIEFKKNPNSDSIYNFISKLQIKIPFLTLKNEEKEINSLKENIDEQLISLNYSVVVNNIISANDEEMELMIDSIEGRGLI